MKKQKLRLILGQLIELRNGLRGMETQGFDWAKLNDLIDYLRNIIADLEDAIDSNE